MRFFTRSSDLETQCQNRSPPRSRSRSQSTAPPVSASRPRSRSRSTSTTKPVQPLSASPPHSAPVSKTSSPKTNETTSPTTGLESPPVLVTHPPTFQTAITTQSLHPTWPTTLDKGLKKEVDEEKTQSLLDKYDPGTVQVPNISTMDEHRGMVRTVYLDNILWATARLQRHLWIEGSEKECFKQLRTDKWRETIHEDLMRYTKAVKAYEYWAHSFIQKHDLVTPPDFDIYSRTLAILKCASKNKPDFDNKAMINTISASLFKEFSDWSRLPMTIEMRAETRLEYQKRGIWDRMAMGTLGVLTLIVPTLIMILDWRTMTTVFTTSVFALTVGLVLAKWWKHADLRK